MARRCEKPRVVAVVSPSAVLRARCMAELAPVDASIVSCERLEDTPLTGDGADTVLILDARAYDCERWYSALEKLKATTYIVLIGGTAMGGISHVDAHFPDPIDFALLIRHLQRGAIRPPR